MEYSIREEIANAISHGIGVLLSIGALAALIFYSVQYGDAWHIVSVSIFGASLILLYLCSTLVHSITYKPTKDIFEIMDHSAIYVLIAGTYTPFLLVSLRGTIGWTLFSIIWALALAGIVFKIFYCKKFIVLSTLLYIAMGWLIIFAIKPLAQQLTAGGMIWLVSGGILYTVGTIFYVWRRVPFHHAIWHLFVLAGSVCHFSVVLFYVVPFPR
ncbi:PAQR family membrane homeostasis protein TrhA [Paenibacillus larvae]|uniref:PAQR family membrane homeostasis protein TrhA n=1 Tax=Paenibacillus larvae TaxID=1464 RepID=UPI002853FAE8|nr:hemolysin III family protein [Paenibacillus larvae]MDR5597959.1 hemolysin III family protein [Paenibacillus larvae]